MNENYTQGIAFIMEGDTEKVFYLSLLEYLCKKHPDYRLNKYKDSETGENFYTLSNGNAVQIIKLFVVGSISQVTNSGTWFEQRCYKPFKALTWNIFLCYDTDSYQSNISKFQEDDWKELRKSLTRHKTAKIFDLAAQADIEDIMLCDSSGIFTFLSMPPVDIPSGSKGKRKMKKLFRMKGQGVAYHEGIRANNLIHALNFDVIIADAPVPLHYIEDICFSLPDIKL